MTKPSNLSLMIYSVYR